MTGSRHGTATGDPERKDVLLFLTFSWRGYLLDRLQLRWNALVASLVLGLIHAQLHV